MRICPKSLSGSHNWREDEPTCEWCNGLDPSWWPGVGNLRLILEERELNMAKVRQSNEGEGSKVRAERPEPLPALVMPKVRNKPSSAFEFYHVFLHGEKKIGKSHLADSQSVGVDTLFCQWDREQRAYNFYEVLCSSWRHFISFRKLVTGEVESGRFKHTRLCVDGVDIMHKDCMAYVCQKYGVKHPSDGNYGDVWDALRATFTEAIRWLLSLPCGVWFTSHSTWKEVRSRKGDKSSDKIERLVPLLSGTAEEIVNGLVDATFAMAYDERQRILILQGDESVTAGHGLDQPGNPHFRDAVTGEPLIEIPLGSSIKEGCEILVQAFNNEWTDPKNKKTAAPKVSPNFKKKVARH